MLIYLILIGAFGLELYRNVYPDNCEKMLNKITVKYNVLKCQLEKNETLKETAINISYKCIYFYSLCQIQFNKANNIISPFIQPFIDYLRKKTLLGKTCNILVLIDENGNNLFSTNIESDSSKTRLELISEQYNYSRILFIDKNSETEEINYVFYDEFPETFDYNICNIKFLSVELDYENKTYPIYLMKNGNYYIVNNCLNKNFFKYYLKNVLKININDNNFDYKVTIIDNDVKFITLDSKQSIIFGKNNYDITFNLENNIITENEVTNKEESTDSDKSDDFIKLDASHLIFA